MRVPFLIAAAAALTASTALAQTPPANINADTPPANADAPPTAVEIGPWRIQVSSIDGTAFDRCIMSRTTEEGIEARFTRGETGLGLTLTSPRWQLEDGARYDVVFAADQRTWDAEVAATTTVSVALTDEAFNQGLRLANRLEVRGAGSTIVIPLDSSSAALARLESCYERNSATAVTNPFVAPTRTP